MRKIRDAIICILLIILDQASKFLAVKYLRGQDAIELIPGVFELRYLENRGAAFGILQNQQLFFITLTWIVIGLMCYILFRLPEKTGYFPLHVITLLLISGAMGNLIDRMMQNYVVDFLYFKLIDFPIFNVADCYVTVSAAVFFVLLLFVYKEEDLDELTDCLRWKPGKKES